MRLDLEVKVFLPKDIFQVCGGRFCTIRIFASQVMVERSVSPAGKRYQAVASFFKQVDVDTRLIVKAVGICLRSKINEVLKPFIILRKENEIVVLPFAGCGVGRLFKTAA